MKKIFITIFITLATGISSHTIIPAKPQSHPIALIGGKVFTVSHGIIDGGTILFDKGKIIAVGHDVQLPADVEKIDVSGKYIYPGFIAPNTNLGLVEIGAVRATRDAVEVGNVNPNVRGETAYNPDSEISPTVRSNGITTAEIVPDGGMISGTSSLLNLEGWTREDAAIKSKLGLHIHWPNLRTSRARESEEAEKKAIEKNVSALRDAFRQAREYSLVKKTGSETRTDVRWEAMREVLNGTLPVFVHANDARQIERAVEFCEKEHLRMVLVEGADAWKVTSLLKEKNIPVILGRVHSLPSRDEEDYDLPYKLPKILRDAGIQFCLSEHNGNGAHRNLPFEAGTAAGFGLTHDEALRAITLSTAEILGVADRIGSLDPGKDATIIVSTGDALDALTHNIELEFIQGKKIDLNNKQKELYLKYKQKYEK